MPDVGDVELIPRALWEMTSGYVAEALAEGNKTIKTAD
jgi:hypothetical protein